MKEFWEFYKLMLAGMVAITALIAIVACTAIIPLVYIIDKVKLWAFIPVAILWLTLIASVVERAAEILRERRNVCR